jgi:hypothetical protein
MLNGTTGLDLIAASTPYALKPNPRIAPMANHVEPTTPPEPERADRVVFPAIHTGALVALIRENMARNGEPLDGYCDYLPGRNDALIASLAGKTIWEGTKTSHVAHARGTWVGKVQRPAAPKPKTKKVPDLDELRVKVEFLGRFAISQTEVIDKLSARIDALEARLEMFE